MHTYKATIDKAIGSEFSMN